MMRYDEGELQAKSIHLQKIKRRKTKKAVQAFAKEKKRLAISNAARQWEAEFGVASDALLPEDASDSSRLPSYRSGYSSGKDSNGDTHSDSPAWLTYPDSQTSCHEPHATSCDMSETYLAEIDRECLQLFGPGALDSLEKNWGAQVCSSVTTITVQFINFDNFASYIPKVRSRFPNAVNLILKEVNLHSLPQINALAQMRRLESISIECGPGNPVTQFSLWRSYLLFRLSHFKLQRINNDRVTPVEVNNAEKLFTTLSDETTSELSRYRLLSITGEVGRVQPVQKSKAKTGKEDRTLECLPIAESVGKVGLQCWPTKLIQASRKNAHIRKQISHQLVQDICDEVVLIEKKHAALNKVWMSIFIGMIKEFVIEMWNKEEYMKKQYDCLFEVSS